MRIMVHYFLMELRYSLSLQVKLPHPASSNVNKMKKIMLETICIQDILKRQKDLLLRIVSFPTVAYYFLDTMCELYVVCIYC